MPKILKNTTTHSVADMQYPVRVAQATWWRYVVTVTGNAAQKDIATATGIDQSSISRWQRATNTPRAEAVVALARAYGRSPVEALVAAGYLSSSEVGVVELTTLTGDLTGVSIDSLLSELRRRVLAANPEEAQSWPTGWSADNPAMGRGKDGDQSGDLSG
jgi:transcriptional regulator with XRE-family HTH domain